MIQEDAKLHRLAYRMLGSVSDAEDVVQEAKLKLVERTANKEPIPDREQAYLYRVVSNLCIDRLRRLKLERQTYVGPWLPDPAAYEEPDEHGNAAELAENLSIAFMLMLEKLTPEDRVVYVLREGFDFSYAEIGELLQATPVAVRQRASRARKRLGTPVAATPAREQRRVLERMIDAVARRDIEGLVELLAPDAVAYTDGGGVVSAALVPVATRERIAQVTLHLVNKTEAEDGALQFRFAQLNGGEGLVVMQDQRIHSTIQVDVTDGLVTALYVTRNPHKLDHLARSLT